MYELGRSLGADRISVASVLEIPLGRIREDVLLRPEDAEAIRPYLTAVLERDKLDRRLQIEFPYHPWQIVHAEIRRELGYAEEAALFPTAPAFREENGHCFFSWYTATIRGNGELYPCCLLMQPDYKPLGNALSGRFVDHWNGPAFTQMRREQREILLAGDDARFDPSRHKIIRRQCVDYGACWLKNMALRVQELRGEMEVGLAAQGALRVQARQARLEISRLARLPVGLLRAGLLLELRPARIGAEAGEVVVLPDVMGELEPGLGRLVQPVEGLVRLAQESVAARDVVGRGVLSVSELDRLPEGLDRLGVLLVSVEVHAAAVPVPSAAVPSVGGLDEAEAEPAPVVRSDRADRVHHRLGLRWRVVVRSGLGVGVGLGPLRFRGGGQLDLLVLGRCRLRRTGYPRGPELARRGGRGREGLLRSGGTRVTPRRGA